jgi:hypothetical protein
MMDIKKNKYTKEDLLWEATRRNQIYRDEFQNIIDDKNTLLVSELGCGHQYGFVEVQRIRKLIFDKKILPAYSERWGIEFYNPYISVDDIKEEISKGYSIKEEHPYYNYYGMQELSVIEHKTLKNKPELFDKNYNSNYNSKNFKLIKKHFSYPYFIISPKAIINRTVISFNPESNFNDIIEKINNIRNRKLKNVKLQLKESKTKTYNPAKINTYIEWLKIYDAIEKNIFVLNSPKECKYENGVIVIPDMISFMQIIPSDYNTAKFESERRRFERAFSGASDLIKASPSIYFNPSRVAK